MRRQTTENHVIVHEHRAPSDESIRIAEEMRDKLLARHLASIPLEGNEFHGHVEIFLEAGVRELQFIALAKVNERSLRAEIRRPDNGNLNMMAAFEDLKKALAEQIAETVLMRPFLKATASAGMALRRR